MLEYFGTAFAVKLIKALAACVGLVLFSKWLDLRSKIDFAEFFRDLKDDPQAAADYLGKRFIGMAIVISMALLVACSPAPPETPGNPPAATETPTPSAPPKPRKFATVYDVPINVAVATWWLDYPHPTSAAAQLYQESRFKPDAVSPAGAQGIAQFMPATWAQVVKEMGKVPGASPLDPYQAIDGYAFHMLKQRKFWTTQRPPDETQKLAQACYNAGCGNIVKAQKACGGALLWDDIKGCLPKITGRYSAETIDYIEKIARWRAEMEGRA